MPRFAILGALLLSCATALADAAQSPAASTSSPPVAASLPDFTGIVERNAAAVVHVEARYDRGAAPAAGDNPQDRQQLDILRQLFGLQGVPVPQEPAHTSLGSGFIISADGYILTNNHVVKGATAVSVRLQDHRTLNAKVIGTDSTYDIALLKVDAGKGLPAVSMGDSHALKPGQWVLAIGSPFGFDYTVTQGIVSAVGRHLGSSDQPWVSFIQTDVPINRGNSGGPLFNLQGQVIGINSQIYSSTGGYQGISFSIPIDVAMHAVSQLKQQGYVSRGVLGVLVQPLDAGIARSLGAPDANGALVRTVSPGSGAAKAGIQPGDVIRAYNGNPIYDGSELPALVTATAIGSRASVSIWRAGKSLTVPVVVAALPPDAGDAGAGSPAADVLGLQVQDLDPATRQQLGVPRGHGVVVAQVTDGPALQQGVQPGDVILRLNQQLVASASGYRAAVAAIKPGATVLLLIQRDDQVQFVALTVPK